MYLINIALFLNLYQTIVSLFTQKKDPPQKKPIIFMDNIKKEAFLSLSLLSKQKSNLYEKMSL